MQSKREEYIRKIFLPECKKSGVNYPSEEEVNDIVNKIYQIGETIGYIGAELSHNEDKNAKRKHKYDVWIAKEVKKNIQILDRVQDIRLIIDWASQTKANLFSYSFDSAVIAQNEWHKSLLTTLNIDKLLIPELDEKRIVFRFSDNKHFLYILSEDDLKSEGEIMGHCVGGTSYKQRVKNKLSLILSLRDNKNEPHVTIEIDTRSKMIVQQYGKGNSDVALKYKKLIKEFFLYSTNFKEQQDKEILDFLNLHFFSEKQT